MPAENKTLYAKWNPNEYTVTYNVNNGDALAEPSKVVTFDNYYGELPTPTRTGYTFVGWFTEEVDGEEVPQRTDAAEQSEERNPNHARSADEAKQSHAEHGSQGKGEGEAGEPQDFEVFGRVNPDACGASPKHQDRNPREDSEDMSQGGRILVSFFH